MAIQQQIFLVNEQLPEFREFYGRKREVSELLMCIFREGSASIVGPEHIGKTWLITYLCQFAPTIPDKRISIGYIDATLSACDTIAGLAKEVLKALGYYSLSEHESPNLAQLEKYVHSLREEQLVVLCVDNFDALTRRKEFDRSFFEAIRAIAQRDLCLVATSKEPLIDLVSKSTHGRPDELRALKGFGSGAAIGAAFGLLIGPLLTSPLIGAVAGAVIGQLVSKSTHSSPFFNIFNQIKLTSFDKEEALEFISDKGLQAGFTPDEQEYLLKYAQDRADQCPPLRLQLVGKLLLQDKRAGIDIDSAYWQNFSRQLDKQYRQMVT